MNHLICPICSSPLTKNDQGVGCENRHQFDRAREGYLNLLPVQHKGSREPGDAKIQLESRRQFLAAGFFSPLVNQLQQLILPNVKDILDIGCGDGYFTLKICKQYASASVYGVDIAKVGIRLAAKGAPANFIPIVASSYQLPVASFSMDVITRIYAPSKDEELARVLRPDGHLIVVIPGENHLLALRNEIYQTLKPHQVAKTPKGFVEKAQFHLRFDLDIPGGKLTQAFLQMTPFAWRLSQEKNMTLTNIGWRDQADFTITLYQK